MAQWQMHIDFSKAKKQYQRGLVDVQELADLTAGCLLSNLDKAKKIDHDLGFELEDVIEHFICVSQTKSTIDDYDDALELLYDWADTKLDSNWNGKKMAWIVP